ncbi:MAG: potassium transporter TrkA [Gammaproteobacteria bacterium]|nr:MAG: potassium transporter TrkA [Gammaproteobacteria bacterium]
MNRVTFLVLRRMRTPLLVLLGAYTITVLGLTLIPGVDDQGQPWRMDFFHAFYFISYMATTIGFGEIPYEFSEGQRLWVTFSIYITVIAWLYAIGVILNLVQDPAFRRAVVEGHFARSVRSLREPFYLVCGFGDTGKSLIRALTEREMRAVVIDNNQEAINDLALKDYLVHVPGLYADVRQPEHLIEGGLKHDKCEGIVALTNDDRVNLKIAITSKLLNKPLPVICRAEDQDYENNMESFGTDYIIDPFLTFADRFASALHKPGLFILHHWLTEVPYSNLPEPLYPPSNGTWLLCGYGRFGKAVHARLQELGISTVVIEAKPEGLHCPAGTVEGRGTEASTLQQAGVENAVGIIAGTNDDANNLSIVMTAKELNPGLFVTIRQNRNANRPLFEAFHADLVMQPSEIIAREIRVLLTLPMLSAFLKQAASKDNDWANQVASRIVGIIGEVVPDVWTVEIEPESASAVFDSLMSDEKLQLAHLCRDPRARQIQLCCLPLYLVRGQQFFLIPDKEMELKRGDKILFCGAYGIAGRMHWVLHNANALHYVVTGDESPAGYVWQWIKRNRNYSEKI